jgi:hypothetical protein
MGFYFILCTQIAYCYLDPGTGSLYLQLIASILLGLLFSIKMFWSRIKAIPKRLHHKDKEDKDVTRKET